MHSYTQQIVNALAPMENPEIAGPMAAYMKHNFHFLGIKSPLRKELTRSFLRKDALPEMDDLKEIVRELWELEGREYQYFALALMEKLEKEFPKDYIDELESLVLKKSWWDSIDYLAPQMIATHFLRFPELRDGYVQKWIDSDNIWLQRCAVLFALKYKDKTDLDFLYQVIDQLKDHKEFFIRKAIGWVLRENSKRIPNEIIEYINTTQGLSPLSKKEGLKVLVRKGMI